jgi:3-hydroxy-9,10-secoandrosta-1,3,5(10)-triene-9,17-dione monooxygenase reductase component
MSGNGTLKKSSSVYDSTALRNALGSFATGITVVTAIGADSQHVGMTANSFNSVSLDPPLILWSISKESNCFNDFIQAKSFSIHVLDDKQQDISDQFAQSGGDKFEGITCTEGSTGTPLLPNFSACFECTTEHQYDGGDHVILVGRVIKFTDRGTQPLVFYRGKYTSI